MTSRRTLGGPGLLAVASVIAGVTGFAVTIIAGQTPIEVNTVFNFFWSAMYLLIGCLLGFLQEYTRLVAGASAGTSTDTSAPRARRTRGWRYASVWALAIGLAVVVTVPFWGAAVFGSNTLLLGLAIAVGAGSYVYMAAATGILTGRESWSAVSALIAWDGIIRLVLVGGVVLVSSDPLWLAWAAVAPLPLTVLFVGLRNRRELAEHAVLPIGAGGLSRNIARTVLASVGSAMLVTGLPILLFFFIPATTAAELAARTGLIMAITLTRAPLLMPLNAFQNYLIGRFVRDPAGAPRFALLCSAAVVAVGLLGGALAWLVGGPLYSFILPRYPALDGFVLGVLVAASAALGVLYVSGAAVLARAQHTLFAAGWLISLAIACGLLAIPGELVPRVVLALVIGPLAGALVHWGGILRGVHPARPAVPAER